MKVDAIEEEVMRGGIKFREVRQMLVRNDFEFDRQNGGHQIFRKGNICVSIPISTKGVNHMILRRIMKSYDLTDDPLFNKV